MVRAAVDGLGEDATREQVVRFIQSRFDQRLDSRFVPIYRATLQGEDERRRARERAATAVEPIPTRSITGQRQT
jgi:hypothetical protein